VAARTEAEAAARAPFTPEWFGELLGAVRAAGIAPVSCYYEASSERVGPIPLIRRRYKTTVTHEYAGDRWFILGQPGDRDEYDGLRTRQLAFDAAGRFWDNPPYLLLEREKPGWHDVVVVDRGLRPGPACRLGTVRYEPMQRYLLERDNVRQMCAIAVHRLGTGEAGSSRPGVIDIGYYGR
jgi:hypothetical protein